MSNIFDEGPWAAGQRQTQQAPAGGYKEPCQHWKWWRQPQDGRDEHCPSCGMAGKEIVRIAEAMHKFNTRTKLW